MTVWVRIPNEAHFVQPHLPRPTAGFSLPPASKLWVTNRDQHPLLEGLPEWKNTWVQMSQEKWSAHEERLVLENSCHEVMMNWARNNPDPTLCTMCLSNPLVSLGIFWYPLVPCGGASCGRSCKESKWFDFCLLIFGRSTSWIVTWPAALVVVSQYLYLTYIYIHINI